VADKDLRPGWKSWRFEQMATNVNVRIDNPSESGMEHYVGLEHLDPDSLRIRRWGSPDDVEATKLCFKKGDIIFARRRAYQRKLGVAEFDGICSAHAMVLRAKPEVVLPEFLPFFMQSDLFMNRAVEISVGSLSPTINWKTMAVQKFVLPPVVEQQRMAKIFSATLHLLNCLCICRDAAKSVLHGILVEEYEAIRKVERLQSLCRPIVRGIDSPGLDVPGGVPYVRVSEMTGPDGIVVANLRRTSVEIAVVHPESRLLSGDLVVALRGVVGRPVRVPKEAEGANLSRGTARVSVLEEHSSDFIYWALRSPRGCREVLRFATGWKGEDLREITLTELRELCIPCHSRTEQDRIAEEIAKVTQSIDMLTNRLASTREFLSTLVDACLRGAANVY
jgi:type I restriction enzyme S subunit